MPHVIRNLPRIDFNRKERKEHRAGMLHDECSGVAEVRRNLRRQRYYRRAGGLTDPWTLFVLLVCTVVALVLFIKSHF